MTFSSLRTFSFNLEFFLLEVLSCSTARTAAIFILSDCLTVCSPLQHRWMATGPWLVILYRNFDSSVVWTDLECAEERLRHAPATGGPPRPQRRAPVLGQSEGKPAGHPGTSTTLALWTLAGEHFMSNILQTINPNSQNYYFFYTMDSWYFLSFFFQVQSICLFFVLK